MLAIGTGTKQSVEVLADSRERTHPVDQAREVVCTATSPVFTRRIGGFTRGESVGVADATLDAPTGFDRVRAI